MTLAILKDGAHYAGETPDVKFIIDTLGGVSDVRSSYHVYFAPFTPNVWFTFLASACVSLAVETILVRTANSERSLPLIPLASDLAYRKLSSFAGQFRSSRRSLFTFLGQNGQSDKSGIMCCIRYRLLVYCNHNHQKQLWRFFHR